MVMKIGFSVQSRYVLEIFSAVRKIFVVIVAKRIRRKPDKHKFNRIGRDVRENMLCSQKTLAQILIGVGKINAALSNRFKQIKI